ncbi:MAG: hypothetical protein U5L06_16010 [Rhodovibrio sp.]|nr:hypothetical protein [Rhodovibrio sp.]
MPVGRPAAVREFPRAAGQPAAQAPRAPMRLGVAVWVVAIWVVVVWVVVVR